MVRPQRVARKTFSVSRALARAAAIARHYARCDEARAAAERLVEERGRRGA